MIETAELADTAAKAFPTWEDARDADAAWTTAAELGWFMVLVPEEHGGLELGREAAAALFEQFGRVLLPGAVVGQFLALEALSYGGNFDGRTDLIGAAMAGERIAVPLADEGMRAVVDADLAERMLMWSGIEVALVSLDGAALDHRETWDESRRLFDVVPADDAERIVLAQGDAARALAGRIEGLRSLALAGECVGGARAALGLSVDYLKERRQFDRPLAMFQALKHRAADLQTKIAMAEAFYLDRADASDPAALGALKAHCASVYRDVAEEAVQFHGGIGLTEEHPIHRFFKRAFLNEMLGGTADTHEEAAGRAVLAESDRATA